MVEEPAVIEGVQIDMSRSRSAAVLVQFAYVSRPAPGLPLATLLRLARQSWSFNRTVGITGCLRYDAGRFLQVIEGPSEVVLPLSSRILADERHGEIAIEAFGPIAERRFGDWRIEGFEGVAADTAATLDGLRAVTPGCAVTEIGFRVWPAPAMPPAGLIRAAAATGSASAGPSPA
jgi:hypothetical protein